MWNVLKRREIRIEMLFLLPARVKSTLETGLGSKYSIILLLPMLFRVASAAPVYRKEKSTCPQWVVG